MCIKKVTTAAGCRFKRWKCTTHTSSKQLEFIESRLLDSTAHKIKENKALPTPTTLLFACSIFVS